ncbi:MAG: hypothetical protein JXA54_15590 [Candidatus Heimdallarchaeota archaeon]|nr:hypothetical protein [Candidatus Heimdallarchaeota archaeon]
MVEESSQTNKKITRFKEVNLLIRENPQNKFILNRLRIGYLIITTLYIAGESIFSMSFNPIFFFLSAFKIVVAFSPIIYLGYLVFGRENDLPALREKSTKLKEMNTKFLLLLKDIALLFIIPFALFGIIHLAGLPDYIETNFVAENPGLNFPTNYHPSALELVLLLLIIIFLLLTLYFSSYWLYSRCLQYTGYNTDKKILKIKLSRTVLGYAFNATFFSIFLTFIIDDLFVATKFPGIIASWAKFETIFASNAYILLVIELAFIVALNLFYIIDGFLANKYRKNFVALSLVEPL